MKTRAEKGGMSSIDATGEALKRIANDAHEFYDYIHNIAPIDFIVNNNDDTKIDDISDRIFSFIYDCERE